MVPCVLSFYRPLLRSSMTGAVRVAAMWLVLRMLTCDTVAGASHHSRPCASAPSARLWLSTSDVTSLTSDPCDSDPLTLDNVITAQPGRARPLRQGQHRQQHAQQAAQPKGVGRVEGGQAAQDQWNRPAHSAAPAQRVYARLHGRPQGDGRRTPGSQGDGRRTPGYLQSRFQADEAQRRRRVDHNASRGSPGQVSPRDGRGKELPVAAVGLARRQGQPAAGVCLRCIPGQDAPGAELDAEDLPADQEAAPALLPSALVCLRADAHLEGGVRRQLLQADADRVRRRERCAAQPPAACELGAR